MEIFFYILAGLVGLCIGSFFNVVIFRHGSGEGIIRGHSICRNCRHEIGWRDLIPVISYFVLKGKCRNCKVSIPPLYVVVEIVTAAVLVALVAQIGILANPVLLVLMSAIVLTLVLIAFLDLKYMVIPDKLVLLLLGASLAEKLVTGADLKPLLISALGMSAVFAILFIVSRGKWVGLGDAKLIFFIGFALGYPLGYLSVVFAIWAAGLFSVILLVSKRATMKTQIPLGTFLALVTILLIIYQNELWELTYRFY